MDFYALLLKSHVLAGGLGLLLGPVAFVAPKRRGIHTMVGSTYHWLVFWVCLSGLGMSVLAWERNAHLFFIALFSYFFAARGYLAARKKYKGWLKNHITGMLGSYIAMTTALLVVNRQSLPFLNSLPPIVTWLLPSILGSPVIALVQRKFVRKGFDQ